MCGATTSALEKGALKAADRMARHGKRLVVGYLGITGFQDGLDHVAAV